MAQSDKFKNKCQYWATSEPPQCVYWDADAVRCKYSKEIATAVNLAIISTPVGDNPEDNAAAIADAVKSVVSNADPTTTEFKDDTAERAPYCNLIGTSILCNKYKKAPDAKDQQRCILPDPRRHVCNRTTGLKWVTLVSGTWGFDAINGYNDGTCDSFGTDVTCSGYSPYHMGFGTLTPSDDPKYDTFKDSYGNYVDQYSTTKEFGYRLPTNFVVYNLRAVLSKCYWWKDVPGTFTVDPLTGEVSLSSAWMCNSPSDTSKHSLFTLENGPPCNGCKPECLSYIGVCWQYCIDDKMEPGDPILAEQIHELRYYHRENGWTTEAIELLFLDHGNIFAWTGTKDNGMACELDSSGDKIDEECVDKKFATLKGSLSVTLDADGRAQEYEIPAVHTKMPSFDTFIVEHKDVVLTNGTQITGALKDYPTLIREIKQLSLSPIIQNKFNEYVAGAITNTYGQYSGDGGALNNNYTQGGNGILPQKLFETPYLNKNTSALIYGKVFYKEETFAINLSDKELKTILPNELYLFDNIYDIESNSSIENFEIFRTRLTAVVNAIKKISPDKIFYNTLPLEDYAFIIDVPVLSLSETYSQSNENIIAVFQEVDDYLTYSKVSFTKRVVGGVLIQSKFSVLGDGLEVKKPVPYFEKSFMGRMNDNTSISFDFNPFHSESITTTAAYYYSDSTISDPITGDMFLGFKPYKVILPIYIADFKQIGSSCYFRVIIEHPYINSICKPFEADTITIGACEMKITHHGADGKLPSNQLIIEPKNKGELVSLCESGAVVFRDLTYFEKRSFGQVPTCTSGSSYEIDDSYTGSYTLDLPTSDSNEPFRELTNFDFPMTPTVVMSDSLGRPITQSRTKPIGLVKQVTCPDVEIAYNWTAKYDSFYIRSVCAFCVGEWWEEKLNSDIEFSSSPKCGDHWEYCGSNRIGPMWWPYNTCDEYDSYNQVTNLDNYSFEMLELFKEKDASGSYINGSFNHRMLGPHKHYGKPGLGCPPRMCYCMSEIFNWHTTGDPYFTGYAKVRAGVPDNTISAWCRCGSSPIIQFGNERRPVLRSYRTIDAAPFIRLDVDLRGGCAPRPRTDWRLMPASMLFSRSDITLDEDEMWDYSCSTDGRFNVINPLGFFTASTFDGVSLKETVDYHNRFRFEEIIRCKYAMNLGYPKNVGEYINSTGDSIVSSWYEFLRYPVGGGDDTVQWAWREPWKPLVRNSNNRDENYQDFVENFIEKQNVGYTKGGGIFNFLIVEYPKYLYDYMNKEFRLVIEEGEHLITFMAPKKDEYTGEYKDNCRISLDNGPPRCFDEYGVWIDDGGTIVGKDAEDRCEIELYSQCISNPSFSVNEREIPVTDVWSEEVTLFAPGYTDPSKQYAEEDGRKVVKFGQFGDITNTYFHRGLKVTMSDNLTGFPVNIFLIEQMEISSGEVPFEYICGVFDSQKIFFSFDEVKRSVGRLSITLKLGKIKADDGSIIHYHLPAISVYTDSVVSGIKPILYRTDNMKFYDGDYEIKTLTFEWDNMFTYLIDGSKGVWIEFRVTPNDDELADYNLKSTIGDFYKGDRINMVAVTNVMIYEDVLRETSEQITVWERKYYVSHGGSSVYPPQGEEDESVLTKLPGNSSTCWQLDTADGVSGVPNSSGEMTFMNKVRGRFVFELYEDGELISGSLAEMENFQRKLYNKAADKALTETETSMKGVIPPGLSELLQANGIVFAGAKGLNLKNTLVNRLAEINQFEIMRAGGNSYLPLHVYDPTQCSAEDYYINSYTNMDTFTADHMQQDYLTQYAMGGIWIIERREMNFSLIDNIFPKLYGRSTGSRIYKQIEESSLIYPEVEPNLRWVSGGTSTADVQYVREPLPINIWMGGLWWGAFTNY